MPWESPLDDKKNNRARSTSEMTRLWGSCTNYANGCSFGLVDMKLGYRL